MRRLFILGNCAFLALAAVVLVPAFALASVPSSYTSYGYASGVHEIAGSDAFPNFQNGAVNNRYPLAQVQQDASPSTAGVATYADTGPLAATAGSQYNQDCANGSSQPPPSQICQNPNNQAPYATSTYPGGPATAHVDACNGCGNPPRGDSSAAELTSSASAVYSGGTGQPFSGAYGSTTTTMGQDGTLLAVTHSEVDSFTVGDVQVSKVVVVITARSTLGGGGGDASVEGGQVTANGQPVAVTDQGVTIEDRQPAPCPSPPPGPGTGPLPASAPSPSPPVLPSLPVGSRSGVAMVYSTSCVPAVDVTYIKVWTVAPTKTISGSHVTIWATGLHVLVTHPSPGPGVPTQSTEYVLGEGYVDMQAGSGPAGFNFGGFGGVGGFGGFGGFGDQGAGATSPGSGLASAVGTALLANRVPLAWMFLTLEALILAAAAAWVWARNTPPDSAADEVLSP
jgi:hypothetical protein